MGLSRTDKARRDKMVNFCYAIICIAKSENTCACDAIKDLALDVANWMEGLGQEEADDDAAGA